MNASLLHVMPSPADERLVGYLSELGELSLKREALRSVYRMLEKSFADHPNVCIWQNCLKRSADAIDRRIEMIMRYLNYGVY